MLVLPRGFSSIISVFTVAILGSGKPHPVDSWVQCCWSVIMAVLEVLTAGTEEMLNRPCVDCGRITGSFCDFCLAVDRLPRLKWYPTQATPLCTECDRKYSQCRFCRADLNFSATRSGGTDCQQTQNFQPFPGTLARRAARRAAGQKPRPEPPTSDACAAASAPGDAREVWQATQRVHGKGGVLLPPENALETIPLHMQQEAIRNLREFLGLKTEGPEIAALEDVGAWLKWALKRSSMTQDTLNNVVAEYIAPRGSTVYQKMSLAIKAVKMRMLFRYAVAVVIAQLSSPSIKEKSTVSWKQAQDDLRRNDSSWYLYSGDAPPTSPELAARERAARTDRIIQYWAGTLAFSADGTNSFYEDAPGGPFNIRPYWAVGLANSPPPLPDPSPPTPSPRGNPEQAADLRSTAPIRPRRVRPCNACLNVFIPTGPWKCPCGKTAYCSTQCQKVHWPCHKPWCSEKDWWRRGLETDTVTHDADTGHRGVASTSDA